MRIDQNWLTKPEVQRIFGLLGPDPDQVRIAGGAVRDALLQVPLGDVDFATTLKPTEVISRAEAAGLRAIPTGIDHGTITLVCGSESFEVTTLREDIETDGRHAVVRFGTNWRRDAERRDFTMNALYLEADGTVFDPLGGLSDCLERRIRFVGEPSTRICEDYLRILRFFRFAARFSNAPYDRAALKAISTLHGGLTSISRERISVELRKLVVATDASTALQAMRDTGVIDAIEPRAAWDLDLFNRANHLATQRGLSLDALSRLYLLFAPTDGIAANTPVTWLKDSLRLSNTEIAFIAKLNKALQLGSLPALSAARECRYVMGQQAALVRLLKEEALIDLAKDAKDEQIWDEAYAIAVEESSPVFPISGADLIARGLKPGPEIGKTIDQLTSIWLQNAYQLTENEMDAVLSHSLSVRGS